MPLSVFDDNTRDYWIGPREEIPEELKIYSPPAYDLGDYDPSEFHVDMQNDDDKFTLPPADGGWQDPSEFHTQRAGDDDKAASSDDDKEPAGGAGGTSDFPTDSPIMTATGTPATGGDDDDFMIFGLNGYLVLTAAALAALLYFGDELK